MIYDGNMMESNRKVYMNGSFVDESEAKISIYDSALMFGDMVFEMTRSFNGVQFKLKEHIDRLFDGLKILRIDIPISKGELEDICLKTVEINRPFFSNSDEHRLIIDISRGLLGIYQGVTGLHKGPNIIVADFPLRWTVSSMGKFFDSGINAVITSQRAIPASLMDPKIKNRSRLFYLMANIEVSQYAGDNNWALMLDTDGFISEGTGDNFFMIKDNIIYTPEGRNILRGISRKYVIEEIAPALGIKVIEKNIEAYDVYTADEAFLTGTPFCMLPVTSLNGVAIGSGKVGPLFAKLLAQWSSNVGIDIQKQIKSWASEDMSNGPTPYQFRSK
jgi:branched-chain amino acid aminotransferase